MNELEYLRKIASLSARTRALQVEYFATRSGEILRACKKHEKDLDNALKAYEDGSYQQKSLFNSQ